MTQLIDLGKLRFHFAGDWSNSTVYESNDIVKYGGNVYVYTHALKTSGNEPTDTAHWALMVEGFKFQGVFNPATAYRVGDGIAHGGKVYVAVLDSTGETPPNSTYWSQFVDGIQYEGTYSGSTAYQKNDVVVYGGSVYIAKVDTTGNLPTSGTYWDKFIEGISPKSVYNNATAYVPGDLVAYGANLYRATANTTGHIPTNTSYWELFIPSTRFMGTYDAATTYYTNDLVVYGNTLYRSRQEQSAAIPTGNTWELITAGTSFNGVYNNSTAYQSGDIITYGANTYIAKVDTTGHLPTDTNYWDLYNSGFSYQGTWSSGSAYRIGQTVSYGGSLFQAKSDNTNTNPTVAVTWDKVVPGFKNRGDWTTATQYAVDDVVVYGGNTFICLTPHASSTFAGDLAATKWQKFNSGIAWKSTWTTTTFYKVGDIVKSAGSTYIATQDHTAAAGFTDDFTDGKWEQFVVGGADVIPPFTAADIGKSLSALQNGADYGWMNPTGSDKVYYVAPHGEDTVNNGASLSTPFASVKYACQHAEEGSTIFVKTGDYYEQLPITVPANVAIVGDNQRTVRIRPKSGNSDDGSTPNANATMFLMSNGSILNKMSFMGMTGWVPGTTAEDVTTSTIRGVVVRMNPASPISSKSPYVLECAAICSGAIGALIDGSVHASGAKTMIFHGYTVISDNGVGYWVKDGGKAEIVSCFTYYCYFGYTSSGGGFIRALNGNNSYGTWGATSRGYDSEETPATGTLYGQQLNVLYQGGNINVGDTITTNTGATAVVLNTQLTANKIYVDTVTGTFTLGDTFTTTSGGEGTVSAGALEDQKGFVIILTGLAAMPKPGASITIAGDTISYVIQSVTGTYVNSSSKIVVVLAQEKPSGTASGAEVTIRYKYSQIRLTGHDFLSIGTGGVTTTNYPHEPTQPAAQGNETDEAFPGRVYYVSTDQDGNFRVGEFFRIDQATGRATLNASAFDLAGLTSLRLGSIGAQLGETINEFSSDGTLSGDSNTAVPTEQAVKTYADAIYDNFDATRNIWSNITSSVRLYGGIIQNNGDGTVRVGSGGGMWKKEASSVEGVPAGECEPMQLNTAQGGKVFFGTWGAVSNLALTNNAYNYIFVTWDHTINNGDGTYGAPKIISSTNFYLQDWENDPAYYSFRAAHPELNIPARRSGILHAFTVGRVYKMDNEITVRVCGTNGWNFNKRLQLFGEEFFPVIRARGLDIQPIAGTLQFNVTEGVMWAEMVNRFTVQAFRMDQGDTFTAWYQHVAEDYVGNLAAIEAAYPTGIPNRPYDILHSTVDSKYYRYQDDEWSEVLDYIESKVNTVEPYANLSALQAAHANGYVNNAAVHDYVLLQLQATDAFYKYDGARAAGDRWVIYSGSRANYVTVHFIGDVAGMNLTYPNGYNGLVNLIVPTQDGMYYEYSGVIGSAGWKRVQGYVERNGWLRFYNQNAVDPNRYNDITADRLLDIPEGRYGVAWIYMVHDNSCHVVYGQGSYTSEEAKQAALPAPLPGVLAAYSTLVGKMTFAYGGTAFENSESPFLAKFISSGVSLHNDLAGLDGGNAQQNKYYHLDESTYTSLAGIDAMGNIKQYVDESDINSALTPVYNSSNTVYNGGGFMTTYEDNTIKISNVVYDANKLPITWTEKFKHTNTTYNYTATYNADRTINTITRV